MMARWVLFFIFYSALCRRISAVTLLGRSINDPDENKNVTELITSKGYPVEEHTVETDDGYLLSVQRIPRGRSSNSKGEENQKGVVLFVHGIQTDASSWVLNFPNQSLGFILPDAGYDTWLVSTRGSTYSRKHVKYTTNQYQFWNFSFDQVGRYDLPATVDYILETTGEEALYIIATSQGTTATFVMLSELPEYNDKIKLHVALAPVAFIGHTTSASRLIVPVAEEVAFLVNTVAAGEFLPDNEITIFLRKKICGLIAPELCELVLFSQGGVDREQLNKTRLGVYFEHYPVPTSANSLLHYAQLVKSKKFRKFDYGSNNMMYYQQDEPPDYDLSRISAPTAFFWSANDKTADPTDVDILRGKLNSLVFDYQIPYHYQHFDFFLALNLRKMVGVPVLQLLTQY